MGGISSLPVSPYSSAASAALAAASTFTS